jgi:hypothetical protein
MLLRKRLARGRAPAHRAARQVQHEVRWDARPDVRRRLAHPAVCCAARAPRRLGARARRALRGRHPPACVRAHKVPQADHELARDVHRALLRASVPLFPRSVADPRPRTGPRVPDGWCRVGEAVLLRKCLAQQQASSKRAGLQVQHEVLWDAWGDVWRRLAHPALSQELMRAMPSDLYLNLSV